MELALASLEQFCLFTTPKFAKKVLPPGTTMAAIMNLLWLTFLLSRLTAVYQTFCLDLSHEKP